MDPIGTLRSVIDTALEIRRRLKGMESNSENCARLLDRLNMLALGLEPLQALADSANLNASQDRSNLRVIIAPSLQALLGFFAKCNAAINDMNSDSCCARFGRQQKHEQSLLDLNGQLLDRVSDLQVTVAAAHLQQSERIALSLERITQGATEQEKRALEVTEFVRLQQCSSHAEILHYLRRAIVQANGGGAAVPYSIAAHTGSQNEEERKMIENAEHMEESKEAPVRSNLVHISELNYVDCLHHVSFNINVRSVPPSYASVFLLRGSNSDAADWVWSFYLYGNDASPATAMTMQIYGHAKGSDSSVPLTPVSAPLKLNRVHHVKWVHTASSSILIVDGDILGFTADKHVGFLDTSLCAKDRIVVQQNIYRSPSPRYHTVLEGELSDVVIMEA